jgi:hypothetical protein
VRGGEGIRDGGAAADAVVGTGPVLGEPGSGVGSRG